MRGLKVCLAAATTAVALVVSGCGAIAPKNVASVDDVGVTMEDVDRVARDPLFGLVEPDAVDYKLPGEAARSALMFELTRAAWIAEAHWWGLDPDSERDAAESDLDQQIASSPEPIELSKEMREAYVDSTAARLVLESRFADLDPGSEEDLRRVYERSPGLWDRSCAWIMSVPEGSEKTAKSLARSGTNYNEIAEQVEGAAVVADPEGGCLSRSSLPFELRDGINDLPLGKSEIFELEFGGAAEQYLIKVTSREQLSFQDAKDDLAQIVTSLQQNGPQAWIATRVAEADVDPRIASAVVLDSNGQPSLLPPQGPFQPKSAESEQPDPDAIQF